MSNTTEQIMAVLMANMKLNLKVIIFDDIEIEGKGTFKIKAEKKEEEWYLSCEKKLIPYDNWLKGDVINLLP